MTISIPYTFVAGTKARAQEVNKNFEEIYKLGNSNASSIAQNALDIDTLDANKANLAGSSTQVFAVADATASNHAVNKQTMNKAITPILDIITGLTITKDSGSPTDTILVSPGSCYDSTKSVVLKLDSNTTKQNLNQGASTTYYVYIIGNDTGSSIDILISQNAVTPSLPTGYTKYRQIGYYTTTSDNKIWVITNNSVTNTDPNAVFSNFTLNCALNVDTDLSSYLPNDNHYYVVWLTGGMAYNGSSANFGRIKIYSDVQSTMDLCRLDGDANRNSGCYGCCPILVGNGRYIHFASEGSYDSYFVGVRGYYKMGRIS